MNTNTGLRFLRTLARRGERVPSYLLPVETESRGAQHLHERTAATRVDEAAGHARATQR